MEIQLRHIKLNPAYSQHKATSVLKSSPVATMRLKESNPLIMYNAKHKIYRANCTIRYDVKNILAEWGSQLAPGTRTEITL